MPSLPNLFIIGAMKSGTTSLHNYLHLHPDIAMSEIKEPGYFVKELAFARGEEWYRSLFDEATYKYRGESSTHYTKLPRYSGVPERIANLSRDVRLIYIMRDPFDRIVSHYWHAVRDLSFGGERKSLLRAACEGSDYLAFSHYARQLQPYIDVFGKASIFTLTFESLLRNPQKELDNIFLWLGLKACSIGSYAETAHNQKPATIQGVAGAGILNRIEYSQAWNYLSPLVPAPFKRLARSLAYKQVDEAQTVHEAEELRARLADVLSRQIDELSQLLGRDFPEWPSARADSSSTQRTGRLTQVTYA